jgi:hypothetical protein
MTRFRSRPREIEAEPWYPGREVPGVFVEEVYATIGGRGHGEQTFRQPDRSYVVTIHGQRAYLAPGDWVVREEDGVHHRVIKPDEMAARYDPID